MTTHDAELLPGLSWCALEGLRCWHGSLWLVHCAYMHDHGGFGGNLLPAL